jgi:hypothetical protein
MVELLVLAIVGWVVWKLTREPRARVSDRVVRTWEEEEDWRRSPF